MGDTTTKPDPITKVSIIISKGSLEGVYPGLIMAPTPDTPSMTMALQKYITRVNKR
jgi:uroporphyrinogen-III synthase